MKIIRTRVDGEPVRRFHLAATVEFRDFEAEEPQRRNYLEDSELRPHFEDWVSSALEDRDDGPSVHLAPLENHSVIRDVWSLIIDANNGHGGDFDDLIRVLNKHGMPCPDDLRDE